MAVSTYGDYLGLSSILALFLVAFLAIGFGGSLLRMLLPRPEEKWPERNFDASEIMLVVGFLFYPALLVALTKFLNSGYTPRYGWPAILGLVLGVVYLFGETRLAYANLLSALLIAFIVQDGLDSKMIFKAGSPSFNEPWVKLTELSRDEAGVPVVIGSGKLYLAAVQYAPPALRDRLVEVIDTDVAARLTGSDSVDKSNRLLARFIPLRIEDLTPFEAAHRKFVVYSGGGYDWFTPYLVERKYNLKLLSQDDGKSIYLAER